MRNMAISLNVNYIEQIVTYRYVNTMDIFSRMGGYKGAFEPLLQFFFPLVILQFLIHYSKTIGLIYKDAYKEELEKNVKSYYAKLNKMENLQEKLDANDKKEVYQSLKS